LSRYTSRLTRVEVHLSNVNGPKGGPDARCTLEARPAGRQPVTVTNDALTADAAVKGAVEKMGRLLDTAFGREDDVRGGPSASGNRRELSEDNWSDVTAVVGCRPVAAASRSS
jgi:hypothetical protein